jgi:hypothetical protein
LASSINDLSVKPFNYPVTKTNIQDALFYSDTPTFTLLCRLKSMIWSFLGFAFLVALGLYVLWQVYSSWSKQKGLKRVISSLYKDVLADLKGN